MLHVTCLLPLSQSLGVTAVLCMRAPDLPSSLAARVDPVDDERLAFHDEQSVLARTRALIKSVKRGRELWVTVSNSTKIFVPKLLVI